MNTGAFLAVTGLLAVSVMLCVSAWTHPVTPYLSGAFLAGAASASEAVVLPAPNSEESPINRNDDREGPASAALAASGQTDKVP